MRFARNAVGYRAQMIESFAAVIRDCDIDADVTKLLRQHALVNDIVFDDEDIELRGDDFGVDQLDGWLVLVVV